MVDVPTLAAWQNLPLTGETGRGNGAVHPFPSGSGRFRTGNPRCYAAFCDLPCHGLNSVHALATRLPQRCHGRNLSRAHETNETTGPCVRVRETGGSYLWG